MLVSSVIDRCYTMFADSLTAPTYLSRANLLGFVNLCNRVLTENLEPFAKYYVLRVYAGMGSYVLPDELRTLLWVEYNGDTLDAGSIRRWAEKDSKWRSKTGTPKEYALDVYQRSVLHLDKIPTEDGKSFILNSDNGVISAVYPAYTLKFDGQTEEFTVGDTVTGAGGSTLVVLALEQNGVFGTLLGSSSTGGVFVDNEAITGAISGAAVADGTLADPTTDDSWTFNSSHGALIKVTDGSIIYPMQNYEGLPDTGGVTDEILAIDGNLLIKYSHYPDALAETDHLYKPYYNAEDMYSAFVLAQMYLVESTEQDLQKVMFHLGRFSTLSGIDMTKLWTPQRLYQPQSLAESSDSSSQRMGVRLPDGY